MSTSMQQQQQQPTVQLRYHCIDSTKLAYVVTVPEEELLFDGVLIKSGAPQPRTNKNGNIMIFVLDVSGSMSSVMELAKTAILRLLSDENHVLFDLYQRIYFISFHDRVETMKELTLENYEAEIKKQRDLGCTNFTATLKEIEKYILERKNEAQSSLNIQCCFVTDGCHNSGGDPNVVISRMKTCYQSDIYKTNVSVAFHALGFTSSHDVKFLQSLISIGNEQGSFQYAEKASDLDECLNQLQALLTDIGSSDTFYVSYKGVEHQKIRVGVPQIIQVDFDAKSVLDSIKLQMEHPSSDSNGSPLTTSLNLDVQQVTTAEEQLELELYMIDMKLLDVANILQQNQPITVEDLSIIDSKLTSVINTDQRFKSSIRDKLSKMKLFERVKGLKDRIAGLYNLSKRIAKKERIDQHELAKLMSTSYEFITKTSLAKKLDRRVQNNLDLFDKIDKAKNNIQLTLLVSDDAIASIPKESLQVFKCPLSVTNWAEMVRDKNSIGFGVSMSRSQAAIADPSQIRIHDVTTTLMCVESFLNTAQYKMEELDMGDGDQKTIHGGFGASKQNSGSVIEGLGREHINGLIPLYIHKDHWAIAKQDLKPLFGWMATLDVFGYNYQQIVSIPMAVLGQFLNMDKLSEMHCVLFLQLWRTCRELMKDTKDTIPDYSVLENRLPDKISTHSVLLAKVMSNPDVLKQWNMDLRAFVLAVLEEEVRRQLKGEVDNFDKDVIIPEMKCDHMVEMKSDQSPSEMYELLLEKTGASQSDDITQEPPTEGAEGVTYTNVTYDVTMANNMFKILLKKLGYSRFPAMLARFTKIISILNSTDVNELVTDIDNKFGVASKELVQQVYDALNSVDVNHSYNTNEETLDLFQKSTKADKLDLPDALTARQVQALIIQCYNQRIHSTRRVIVQSGNVLNPFTDCDKIVDDFINGSKKQQISRINNICMQAYNFEHRYEKLSIDQFLTRYKDQIPFQYTWMSNNRELLKDIKFYNVKTIGSYSITARRDILRVDTEDIFKELIFTFSEQSAYKPCLVLATVNDKVDPSSITKNLKGHPQVVFPDKSYAQAMLPHGADIDSVPMWLANVVPGLMLCVDKKALKAPHTSIYGASGVASVLAHIPMSTIHALVQNKKDTDPDHIKVFTLKRY
jgi:hypothetical protein